MSRNRAKKREQTERRRRWELNWVIVAVFVVVVAGIVGLFVYQETKPLDEEDLRNQVESLQTDVSEALFLIDHRGQSTHAYWLTHLGDMSNSLDESSNTLEQKGYSQEIRDPRSKFLELSDEISTGFHDAALAYEDQQTLADTKKSLQEAG
ncbi:MAG: hypothetical protein M3301_04170, partial [Chloroflexota bacterium]|nr:hypothetical protein [Chloroflexota bacterium]